MKDRSVRCALLLLAVAIGGQAWGSEALLWFDAGRPRPEATHAVDVLASAAAQGLDPADYDAAGLGREWAQALRNPALTPSEQEVLDSALTAALERYLADLRFGRVDPRQVHAHFDVKRPEPQDMATFVRDAVAAHRVTEDFAQAQPRLPMYEPMRLALARYRLLADHPAWRVKLPRLPAGKLVSGQGYSGLELLARRLEALGDLPQGTAAPAAFEGALVAALQSFQQRHGLAPDGVLGRATLERLDVPPAERARQIELSLERLRWTPLLQGPRMVVVNVPEFVLRAYEVRDGKVDVRLSMKVIVGKSMDTRTPLFDEAMRFIEFSPYWNVPPSIARQETVPRLRRDPAYFDQQGFEFVSGAGQVVTTMDPDLLDAVLRGDWRVRQRPGPMNALGDIKFVFPNRNNIYLHHTPAPRLFERDRRDFSHGCIRVEDPVGLARFVLQDQPEWSEDRIRQAMEARESSMLRLRQSLPVLIAYSTVIVKGGRVFFYADLYGHDRLLDRALQSRSAELRALHAAAARSK